MTNKPNLPKRTAKARSAQRFAAIQKRDRDGKANLVLVPGADAKRYQVIIRRLNGSVMDTECRLEVGRNGFKDCPGNKHNTVCYHSMAAIIKMAGDWHVSFCATIEDAKRLSRMNNGIIGTLAARRSRGKIFMVISEG